MPPYKMERETAQKEIAIKRFTLVAPPSFETSAGELYWEAGEANLRSINKVKFGSEALRLHAALCYADSAVRLGKLMGQRSFEISAFVNVT